MTLLQKKLFDFIAQEIEKTGICPSFDEMRVHMGLKAKSGIHRIIKALEERGYVRRLPNRARAIEIIKTPNETGYAKLEIHILLDVIANMARGESLDVNTGMAVVQIARSWNATSFTEDDQAALYNYGKEGQTS